MVCLATRTTGCGFHGPSEAGICIGESTRQKREKEKRKRKVEVVEDEIERG